MLVTVEEAVRYLRASQPVAIPTETVWGLAAGLHDPVGISRIFSLKGRPQNNPLIIHLCSADALFAYTSLSSQCLMPLASAFWPGGLTVVVPVDEEKILPMVRAGLPTAAFRVPAHPTCSQLLAQAGPLVAPSANLSGKPSATDVTHIARDFGETLPVVKTDVPCSYGVESTILVWNNGVWQLGRLGAVCTQKIADVLGYEPLLHRTEQPICPGQLFRHYAPDALLTLGDQGWNEAESFRYDGVLGFTDRCYPGAAQVVPIGRSSFPQEVARGLYAGLREIDERQLRIVYVDIQVPATAEWLVVIDRLRHAARGSERKKKLIDKEKVE